MGFEKFLDQFNKPQLDVFYIHVKIEYVVYLISLVTKHKNMIEVVPKHTVRVYMYKHIFFLFEI